MTVTPVPGFDFDPAQRIWIAIRRTTGNGLHTGLVYRDADSSLKLLHLAFHFDLRRDHFPSPGYYVAPIGLDDDNQQAVSGFAIALAGELPDIRYGFDSSGVSIDIATGRLLTSPIGKGLTCATFVVALFSQLGLDFLLPNTWPVRADDKPFVDYIISVLKEKKVEEAHIAALEADGPSKRFRPDEVVGCVADDPRNWAVDFDRAGPLSASVRQALGPAV